MACQRSVCSAYVFLGLWLANPSACLASSLIDDPKAGPPTTVTTVAGSGFKAKEAVDVYFDIVDRLLVTADGSGNFSGQLKIPKSALPGPHWITAVGRHSRQILQAQFTVRTDWPQFRFSPDHRGENPYENLLRPANVDNLKLRWSVAAGTNKFTSPAVADGVLYAASQDGKLNAFDKSNGKLLWSVSTGSRVFLTYGSPAVADGIAYVWNDEIPPSVAGGLFAFRISDGQLLWRDFAAFGSSPTVADGVVYYSADTYEYTGSRVVAANPVDGSPIWIFREIGFFYNAPAVADGVLYVASVGGFGPGGVRGGYMYAINAATGDLIWKTFVGGSFDSDSAPAIAKGVVYAGALDGGLYAFRAADGLLLWTQNTGGPVRSSPAVANGIVYVGSGHGDLNAFRAWDGLPLWRQATGAAVDSSPAVANGVVYVGSDDGNFYAFKAVGGRFLWSYPTQGAVTSPVVVDGMVYGGSGDGNLYAFGLHTLFPFKTASVAKPNPLMLVPDIGLVPQPTGPGQDGDGSL